jgi:3-phenylpropionate/trans-cinnamate dioxygenase ferredoxin reductase subunit
MMKKICKVRVNDREFYANCGELLLDAALMNGVDIPHDCRSGYCGTCRVNVVNGRVFGGKGVSRGAVHACQSRVISNLAIEIEDTPESGSQNGRVVDLVRLAPDVVEVSVQMPERAEYLPGQHYRVQFRGFPGRCYSPTFPLEGKHDERILRFHVRRVPNGRVSSVLGRQIRIGHRVKVTGPSGAAYLRPEHKGRLVLVASGTGFAPMWSVAVAAIAERRNRAMAVVVGARSVRSLYMIRALCGLARYPNVVVVPVVSEAQTISDAVRTGRAADYVPTLASSDVVYTAGAPAMVESVARMARAAGARCYADPFAPEGSKPEQRPFLARAAAWFGQDSPPLVPDMANSMQSYYDREQLAPVRGASPP